MKPLKEYAPFKIGERFEDEAGDVLEIVSSDSFAWVVVDGIACNRGPWLITDDAVKPIDRTASPKPWRDMTDDEKAPILLAWADGKRIEWWDDVVGAWCENGIDPQRWGKLSYRIAPCEVRGSVSLHGDMHNSGWSTCAPDVTDTHKITFDTINGEPVLDSIKMERLK